MNPLDVAEAALRFTKGILTRPALLYELIGTLQDVMPDLVVMVVSPTETMRPVTPAAHDSVSAETTLPTALTYRFHSFVESASAVRPSTVIS